MLQHWQEFYLLLGTAAAALVALLFVAVSPSLVRRRAEAESPRSGEAPPPHRCRLPRRSGLRS